MAKKTLVHNEKGDFDSLRIDAIDPSDIDEETGQPRFLEWILKNIGTESYWEAIGKDGKVYTVKEDKPVKKGVVNIQ